MLRVGFGAYLALHFARLVAAQPVVGMGSVLLSLLLLAGWLDRLAALALALAFLLSVPPPVLAPAPIAVCLLLLFHAAVPPAPYGSWSARDRADPGGSWRMPPLLAATAWWLLVAFYAASGLLGLARNELWPALADLAFLPLALYRSWRRWLWLLMLALQVALAARAGVWSSLPALVWLHLFAFDPAWVRPAPPLTKERLFYDGTCGLCHRAVRFLLAEDSTGSAFRFAPLDSEAFRRAWSAAPRGPVPDSLILEAENGFLARSAAVLRTMRRLGGLWRLFATGAALVPTPLRDAAYDGVARVRYQIFARPADSCPVTPPHLRARFEL